MTKVLVNRTIIYLLCSKYTKAAHISLRCTNLDLIMEETDKQDYITIRSNYDLLSKAIDPHGVVEQMAEIDATRETKGRFQACKKLLQALMNNGEENVFQTFLQILESKRNLS